MEVALENSCRICMLSADTLVDIFEEHEGRPISEIIKEFSGVKIEKSDLLSKKICKECEMKTLDFHAFRQLCVDSDETVRYNLLLADVFESDDSIEVKSERNLKIENDNELEIITDEHLQNEESDVEDTVEEYFIEDESVEQTVYLQDDIIEKFDQNDEPLEDHHVTVETSEDEERSFDFNGEKKNLVVIERVDSKLSTANSTFYEPSDDLTEKMRKAHFAKEQQKKHKCPQCDKYFMFPSKVTRHVNAVHKKSKGSTKNDIKKNHHCTVCGKAFVSQFKVRRHMVVHDTELKMGLQKNWSRNYFLCELCNKKFHMQTTFDRHKLICDLLQKSFIERPPDHKYFCAICSSIFSTHDDMVEHMKSHISNESQNCVHENCSNVNLFMNDMIRHGKYHEENVTYRCCVCQKTFPNGEEIVAHLLRHKEYKPFSCRDCGKAFFDKYKLRQHVNTHDPNIVKNFICEFCQRPFAAQDYLTCHIRRKHSELKPYQCNFCSKSFAFLHDLNLHSSNHTGNKKHVCVICDSTFTKAWSLKQHLTLHEAAPEIQCDLCDFTAPSKFRMESHLAAHEESQSSENANEETNFTFMETVSDTEGDNYIEEIPTSYS